MPTASGAQTAQKAGAHAATAAGAKAGIVEGRWSEFPTYNAQSAGSNYWASTWNNGNTQNRAGMSRYGYFPYSYDSHCGTDGCIRHHKGANAYDDFTWTKKIDGTSKEVGMKAADFWYFTNQANPNVITKAQFLSQFPSETYGTKGAELWVRRCIVLYLST